MGEFAWIFACTKCKNLYEFAKCKGIEKLLNWIMFVCTLQCEIFSAFAFYFDTQWSSCLKSFELLSFAGVICRRQSLMNLLQAAKMFAVPHAFYRQLASWQAGSCSLSWVTAFMHFSRIKFAICCLNAKSLINLTKILLVS